MQKKILSSVIALCLVGSTSVAFAGGYWSQPGIDVEIEDSFQNNSVNTDNSQRTANFKYGSDNDYSKDVDVDKTFNYSSDSHDNNSRSLEVDLDLDVEKNYNSHNTKQGNHVKGHIVVQQFGGAAGGSGDVISQDNSINNSTLGSYNADDSFNTEDSYNTTKNKSYNAVHDYTSTSSYSKTHNTDIDVDVSIDDSFNKGSYNSKKYSVGGYKRR